MTSAEVANAIGMERERIASEFRTLACFWKCSDCAGHNEHDRCEAPGPEDYAAAITGNYTIERVRWCRK